MTSKGNRRPGAVCQFALGGGRFAYGRLYRDASVAICATVTPEPGRPPIGARDFLFTVGIYEDVPGSSECPIVGLDPFAPGEHEWPPPHKIVDPISGASRIYHRGEIRPATEPETRDLETAAVWDLHHIVERINAKQHYEPRL
jgi:hypothetical protein